MKKSPIAAMSIFFQNKVKGHGQGHLLNLVMFVKHGYPQCQQSKSGKIYKCHILTMPNPKGHAISGKCAQP